MPLFAPSTDEEGAGDGDVLDFALAVVVPVTSGVPLSEPCRVTGICIRGRVWLNPIKPSACRPKAARRPGPDLPMTTGIFGPCPRPWPR